jgi:hypothetical protein
MTLREQERRAHQRRQSKRYLTKEDVRQRYGWASKISVDRAWQIYGSLPKPDLYMARRPLWSEARLDAHDADHRFVEDEA